MSLENKWKMIQQYVSLDDFYLKSSDRPLTICEQLDSMLNNQKYDKSIISNIIVVTGRK